MPDAAPTLAVLPATTPELTAIPASHATISELPAPSADRAASPPPRDDRPPAGVSEEIPSREIGGPTGPEPTRYGDWEKKGRCIDF